MNTFWLKLSSLLLSTFLILGCDGYARTLYLKEHKETPTPWHVGAESIQIAGGQDIVAATRNVAEKLKLVPDPSRNNAWHDNKEHWKFSLSIEKVSETVWVIHFDDWPTSQRSLLSKQAEQQIMELLTKSAK